MPSRTITDAKRIWEACSTAILPDTMGRHGLLILSSSMLAGSRWLEMDITRILSKIQKQVIGSRVTIVAIGTDAVVRRFPDDALKTPTRSIGVAKVRMSAATNFHNVTAR